MDYIKTVWESTTRISANSLNHLETQYDDVMSSQNVWNNHDSRYYTKTVAVTTFFNTSFMGEGSGADADLLDGHHLSDLIGTGLQVGTIVWWNTDPVTLPPGWVVCNGANGTVDYRDHFVVGASSTYTLQNFYGAATVTPTSYAVVISDTALDSTMMPAHTHTYTETHGNRVQVFSAYDPTGSTGSYFYYTGTTAARATGTTGSSAAHTHSGSTVTFNSESNIPPYYSAYLVQRIY
jgi:hypothetical protein